MSDRLQFELPQMRAFGDALQDPVVTDAIAAARQIGDGIREEDMTVGESIALVASLDQEYWISFLEQTMVATGTARRVRYVPLDSDQPPGYLVEPVYDGNINPIDISIDDQPVKPLGFLLERNYNGSLSIKIGALLPYTDENGHKDTTLTAISLNSLISFPDMMSDKHIVALLTSYAPELADDIDRCLFECSNPDEALLLLGSLDLSEIDALASDLFIQQKVSAAVVEYLKSVISLDTHMPYIIDYRGPAFISNEEGEILRTEQLSGKDIPFTPRGFHLIVESEDEGPVLYLEGQWHASEANEGTGAVIKVADVRECMSLRSLVYDQN